MIVLDLQSRVPIYRQIENGIISMILLGACPEGSQLPSVRSLAVKLSTNPNTVQKAYQELESWGVIASVTGRGSFVQSPAAARAVLRRQAVQSLEAAAREAALAGISPSEAAEILSRAWSGEREEKKQDDDSQ